MAEVNFNEDNEYQEYKNHSTDKQYRNGKAEEATSPFDNKHEYTSGKESSFKQSTDDEYDSGKKNKKHAEKNDDSAEQYKRRAKKIEKKTNKKIANIDKKEKAVEDKLEKARYKQKVVFEKKHTLKGKAYHSKLKKGQLDTHGYYEKNRTYDERIKRLEADGEDKKNGRFESTDRYKRNGKLYGKNTEEKVRLHYERYRKAKLSDFKNDLKIKEKKAAKKEKKARLLFYSTQKAFDDEAIRDDDEGNSLKSGIKFAKESSKKSIKKVAKNTKLLSNPYDKEKLLETKERLLQDKRTQLEYKKEVNKQKAQIRAEKNAEIKKRRKKNLVQYKNVQQGSFIQRSNRRLSIAKKKAELVKQRAKSVWRVMGIVGTVVSLLAIVVIIGLIVFMAIADGGSQMLIHTVSMNDYYTMSEITNYYNDLCSELDSKYKDDEKREAFEAELREEFHSDIYEYIYELDAVTYDQVKLLSYLSAKYGTFTLDMTKAELDSIFEEMFYEWHEFKEETRSVFNDVAGEWQDELVWICYVHLETKSTEDVVSSRMDSIQSDAYNGYNLSNLGQQTMGPVLKVDWTNKISSPFGTRFHPIHKEIRMHKGVDIAVPVGTQVYSPVNGKVTLASYSDSAGYWVKIEDEKGFVLSFMHLSSYSVSVGQEVKAGQSIALTGNSGSSTGPHLHLGVQNSSGEYINPVLCVPQTYVERKTASNMEGKNSENNRTVN